MQKFEGFPRGRGVKRQWGCPRRQFSAIIWGTGKATDCIFGRYIHRVHPNKSPLKIWVKRERGCIQGLPKLF